MHSELKTTQSFGCNIHEIQNFHLCMRPGRSQNWIIWKKLIFMWVYIACRSRNPVSLFHIKIFLSCIVNFLKFTQTCIFSSNTAWSLRQTKVCTSIPMVSIETRWCLQGIFTKKDFLQPLFLTWSVPRLKIDCLCSLFKYASWAKKFFFVLSQYLCVSPRVILKSNSSYNRN